MLFRTNAAKLNAFHLAAKSQFQYNAIHTSNERFRYFNGTHSTCPANTIQVTKTRDVQSSVLLCPNNIYYYKGNGPLNNTAPRLTTVLFGNLALRLHCNRATTRNVNAFLYSGSNFTEAKKELPSKINVDAVWQFIPYGWNPPRVHDLFIPKKERPLNKVTFSYRNRPA